VQEGPARIFSFGTPPAHRAREIAAVLLAVPPPFSSFPSWPFLPWTSEGARGLIPWPTEHDARKRILKPWRASDVVRALGFELDVASIILADVSKGKCVSEIDRKRAAECAIRLRRFSQELDHAY
jgi:hypothetical protein